MKIILIGAPGTGKGTQSNFIQKIYNIPKISTGDLLRKISIKNNKKNDSAIFDQLKKGKLINDNIIIDLIIKRINKKDCKNGFLLDGFPRTIIQATNIEKNNIKIDHVIYFWLPEKLIIDRIIGRQIHIASGRIYHEKLNPPKRKGIDDITGEKLITRLDDCKNTIKKRIEEYNIFTAPLIQYYIEKFNQNKIIFNKIDCRDSIFDIKIKINNILK
ncbi:Adenylate kinase [Buchnera aphidicola (Eriosoma grossulariae)]|uniref:adenylate kinase family protein n=1 Tax=Buchnera aphidicola TaxID=9 RepID=UPI00346419BB